MQPNSGVATEGLSRSNTSIGRLIRAGFYAQFAKKPKTSDVAVTNAFHVMDNFDRPRGITIDNPSEGDVHLEIAGLPQGADETYATEHTCWANLFDLDCKRLDFPTYRSMNTVGFDRDALADARGSLKQAKAA